MVMKALSGKGIGGIGGDIEVGVEKKVGTFTINGTTYDRYVKLIDCGSTTANTEKYVSVDINYVGVLEVEGCGSQNESWSVPLPYPSTNALHLFYYIGKGDSTNPNKFYIKTTNNQTKVFGWIHYYR